MKLAEQLLLDLSNPDLRENALLELSKVYFCHCLRFTLVMWFYCYIILIVYINLSGKIWFNSIMKFPKSVFLRVFM